MGRTSPRLRKLRVELARRFPHLGDPDALIAGGEVLVDGFPRMNPNSLVEVTASIALRSTRRLRGRAKLAHALAAFGVCADGRVAVDLGASAGGFTLALLDAGAARVYAVDAGHGQLLGSLRQDPRVVNLERTNLGRMSVALIPEEVGLITMDLSCLAIADAAPQVECLRIAAGADLVALVKPTFELGLGAVATDPGVVAAAVAHAREGLERCGWRVVAGERSPLLGGRGAVEWLIHARRV
jgi:23S rRNA (cytidine1920-2'-O)/16S rRNA (cytidine1409-2'-O)-methyltransferase